MTLGGLTRVADTIKTGVGNAISANPAVAGAVLGVVAGGTTAVGISKLAGSRRKRSKSSKRKSKTTRRTIRHTHRRSRKRIKRGRGLGRREIHHGHKGNKMVSFKTKDGKTVRFKVKGKSRTHTGRRRKRR